MDDDDDDDGDGDGDGDDDGDGDGDGDGDDDDDCLVFSAAVGPLPDVPPIPKAAGTLLFHTDKEPVSSGSSRNHMHRSEIIMRCCLCKIRARGSAQNTTSYITTC